MLFSHQQIPLEGDVGQQLQLDYYPTWLSQTRADQLLALAEQLNWRQDHLRMFGRQIPVPRLHCWYRTDGLSGGEVDYRWSGLGMVAETAPQWLIDITTEIVELAETPLNRCLANYYRDSRDSVDWHADDEAELGEAPIIASLSLGGRRQFQLRHQRTKQRHKFDLEHGSLLIMGAGVQRHWQHRVPKLTAAVEPRINLTLRYIAPPARRGV